MEAVALRMMPCWFPLPPERDARCGALTVPEQWGAARSRMLHLRFVIFRGATEPAADPLIYLVGGPGEPAQIDADSISRWWNWIGQAKWPAKRDLVVFDYRGAGLSEPNMSCPELAETANRVFGEALSLEQAGKLWLAAVVRCRDRLSAAGIDLASYRTESIAEDLHNLLQQLGYKSWDLLAVSYGTRVALTFIDRWPEGTRAVVLDSVYPPGANAYAESAQAAADAFTALFRECAEDRPCRKAFPGLAGGFDEILRHAATAPVTVSLGAPQNRDVRLDTGRLADVLLQAFYDWHEIAKLPATITAVGAGDSRPLEPLVHRMLDAYGSARVSHGLFFSVECQDEFPFNARQAVDRAAAAAPLYRDFLLSNLPLTVCPAWPHGAPTALRKVANPSEVPILMLSGELDGFTPPRWSKVAADGMPGVTRIEFRGIGHGVLEAHDCAGLIVARFLDNPARPPFDDCLLTMGPPPFQTMGHGR